ncbi:MAG: hypothetical protein ACREXS_20850 [Gammaproteobacteria bacterium]
MTELSSIPAFDPLHAPLWRKLLAVRVFLLCFAGLSLSYFFIDWIDTAKPDIPKWLEKGFIILAVLPFLAILLALKEGIADLVVHFVPEGRVRRLLLWGDRTPEAIATQFNESGYAIALLPFFIPLALAALALVVLLLFGGVALVGSLFSAMFSGWPSWAVVITILLVAILLKK